MKPHLTLLFLFVLQFQIAAQIIKIGANGDYLNLAAAEKMIDAGDTLLLQAQTFSDGTQFLENLHGSESAPIVIIAEKPHQSIFQGGTEAIHLINCSYVEINGLVITQQTGNGINIDDGGDYSSPSKKIIIRDCIFRDMVGNGNNDLLKMSGVDSFLIENCRFLNGGGGGSGIDFVGCHWGLVQDCYFDNPGATGIQSKGGTQFIRMQRNIFKNVAQRALNLGGNTGLQYFRPPLPNSIVDAFEAADLEVFSNIFIGSWAPIAYVGSVRVKVYNNTFYHPSNWVIRILQENTTRGFLPCSNNEFKNNIVYLSKDLTEVNIGSNTAAETFAFNNNLWYNSTNNNWSPNLPVTDFNQIIADPLFEDPNNENFRIQPNSPAVGAGLVVDAPLKDFYQFFYQNPPSIGAFEGSDQTSVLTQIKQDDFIQVFPNPTTSKVNIEGGFKNSTIQIINHLGQLMQVHPNINTPFQMDMNELPNGLYFILIKSNLDDKLAVKKLFKQ
jgi:hypothetical protein